MKLLINTESLLPPITGIGTYTRNLLQQFSTDQDFETIRCLCGHRFTSAREALEQSANSPPPTPSKSRIKHVLRSSILAYRARELLRNTVLRLQSGQLKDFLYHEPNFILKHHKGPAVATIHDLSFISYPQYHPAKRVAWLSSELPGTLKRADKLITDSEQVRRELIEQFGVDENKVSAIHLGASPAFTMKNASQTRKTLERYDLKHGQYLLFIGTLEPRKGVDTLLEAWSRLPGHLKRDFPLVLAGAPGWGNREVLARMQYLIAHEGLKHLNFVPSNDLPALYSGASALVYPSHYEGFGLPVLEAMSCGTPIICTGDTSMAEITGEHALHVQAGNVGQLTDRIRHLLENESLRSQLSASGLIRAQDFSWEKCARQTHEIYRTLST